MIRLRNKVKKLTKIVRDGKVIVSSIISLPELVG